VSVTRRPVYRPIVSRWAFKNRLLGKMLQTEAYVLGRLFVNAANGVFNARAAPRPRPGIFDVEGRPPASPFL